MSNLNAGGQNVHGVGSHQLNPTIVISSQSLVDSAMVAINVLPLEHRTIIQDRYQRDGDFASMVNAAILYLATRISAAKTVICSTEEFAGYISSKPPTFVSDFDTRLIMNCLIDDEINDSEIADIPLNCELQAYLDRLQALKSIFN
ncbi:hypothetical protein ACKF11_12750 [Methylobacillus sp. Pita2]|uniref:hypothetical protein n=1 Tax=Methylobacillus sp. Pita2 TaxID=3383245 RepID=UPI0038B42D94